MDYCGPRGIPYLDFLEWDDVSRNAALAWSIRDRHTCSGCATLRSDWNNTVDENGEPAPDLTNPVFLATDVYCPGCDAKQRREEQIRKETEQNPQFARGVHVGFKYNPDTKWVTSTASPDTI